jgi:hypothetical protein
MALAQRRLKDFGQQDRQIRDAYLFILGGKHNAASLAAKLGVSVPTASRLVEGLKKDLARRGKRLVSVRSEEGFHYEVRDDERVRRIMRDPIVTLTIPVRGAHRKGLKGEDRDIYDWD